MWIISKPLEWLYLCLVIIEQLSIVWLLKADTALLGVANNGLIKEQLEELDSLIKEAQESGTL